MIRSRIKSVIRRGINFLSVLQKRKFDNMEYWTNRVQKFGKKSVINIDHSDEEIEEIRNRDKNETFPHLQKLLNGRERMILDFGCGSGRFTADLALLINGKTIGVDPIEGLLQLAPKNSYVEYKLMKEGVVPLPDAYVDVVWIYSVLGCIKGKTLNKIINEIKRVLNKGGLLFLVDNTTPQPNLDHYTYRGVDEYINMFPFVSLKHLYDYFDSGDSFQERFSIMAGRKKY